jgi:large subunit ribosomal protein L24
MAGLKIRKGDRVRSSPGDVGKREITRVFPNRSVIDGVNVAKRHQRATGQTMRGGIIDKDMPRISNVAIVCKL